MRFARAMGLGCLLAIVTLACTPANAGEPKYDTDDLELTVVAGNVVLYITWHPGTTDSVVFAATQGGTTAATHQVAKPAGGWPEPQVDTMLLGGEPPAGTTESWDINAAYWWDNANVSEAGLASLGTVSYTAPFPPGVPPTFDSLPDPVPDDTVVAGPPSVTIVELMAWNSSPTPVDSVVQFCSLARLSDNPTVWVVLTDGLPAPALCVAAAASLNLPSGGGSVG